CSRTFHNVSFGEPRGTDVRQQAPLKRPPMSAVPAAWGSNGTSGSDRRTIAIYEYAPWFNGAPGSCARLPLAAGPEPPSAGRDGNQYDAAHYWPRVRT